MEEEFDYTVEYKPDRIYLQANHLSRLLDEMRKNAVDDRFVDDNLFVVTAKPDWYADIVKFLTTQKLPEDWRNEERRVRVNSRHFVMIGHSAKGPDGLLRICVSEVEVLLILETCHDSACGGHFSSQFTGQKILRAGYFSPSSKIHMIM